MNILHHISTDIFTIESVAAIIQTMIAIVMMITLVFGWKTLRIMQQQIESSITPYLRFDIEYDTHEDFRLVNESSVELRDITALCVIRNVAHITHEHPELLISPNFILQYGPLSLASRLKPHDDIILNFQPLESLHTLQFYEDIFKDDRSSRYEYCIFIRYHRAVDGQPFLKRIMYVKKKADYQRMVHRVMYHSYSLATVDDQPSGKAGHEFARLIANNINEDDFISF